MRVLSFTRVQLQQISVDSVFVFQGISYEGGHHRTRHIEGLLAVGPDMAEVLTVVAWRKASLSSV
jgi:hypothetical protein